MCGMLLILSVLFPPFLPPLFFFFFFFVSPLYPFPFLCVSLTLFGLFARRYPFLDSKHTVSCLQSMDWLSACVCVFGCMHASHVLRHVYLSLSFLRRCAFVYVCVCGYDYADINGGIMMTTAGLVLATKLFDGINGWSSCGCGRCVVPRSVLTWRNLIIWNVCGLRRHMGWIDGEWILREK